MKTKKEWFYLALALILPLVYYGLQKVWYYLIFNLNGIDLLPDGLRTHLLTAPFSLDAIFCILMIAITIPLYYIYKKRDQERIPSSQVVPLTAKGVLATVVIALGLAGVSATYQLIVRTFLIQDATVAQSVQNFDQTFQEASTLSSYIWSFLSVAIFGPIIEELIFRGVLFSGLTKHLSGIWVVLITAVYFGLWHGNPMQMVYTGLLGLGIGLAYATTRNMWFPMLIHLFNNMLSQLPPSWNENEIVVLGGMALRFIAIIPMFIILYRWSKKHADLLKK